MEHKNRYPFLGILFFTGMRCCSFFYPNVGSKKHFLNGQNSKEAKEKLLLGGFSLGSYLVTVRLIQNKPWVGECKSDLKIVVIPCVPVSLRPLRPKMWSSTIIFLTVGSILLALHDKRASMKLKKPFNCLRKWTIV